MKENYGREEFGFNTSIFPVFICFIFGMNVVAIKYSLSGLGVFTSAAIRFFMGACTIFLWAIISKKPLKVAKSDFKKILIVACFFSLNFIFYIMGLNQTTASRAVIILNMQPFYVLILAHFFIASEKIDVKKVFGMAIAFMGIISLFISKEDIAGGSFYGDILVFLGSCFWAFNAVYVKSIIKNMEGFHLVLYPMILSVPVFILGAFIFDDPAITFINFKIISSILYQAFAVASFGFIAWNYLLKRYKASSLYSFVFIMPISGVIGSIIILDEPLTVNLLIALFLVATGIFMVHSSKSIFRHRKS